MTHFLNPGFKYSHDPIITANDHFLKFTVTSLSYHFNPNNTTSWTNNDNDDDDNNNNSNDSYDLYNS